MDSTKVKVTINKIIGKAFSIFGYTFGGLMALGLLIDLTDGKKSSIPSLGENIVMYVFFFAFAGFFIYEGLVLKRRISRFMEYNCIISYNHVTSLENIAASTNRSIDFVKKDLQKLIDKRYFKTAVIDENLGEIIIGKNPVLQNFVTNLEIVDIEKETVKCHGCGALNSKEKNTTIFCEYCGSPI